MHVLIVHSCIDEDKCWLSGQFEVFGNNTYISNDFYNKVYKIQNLFFNDVNKCLYKKAELSLYCRAFLFISI